MTTEYNEKGVYTPIQRGTWVAKKKGYTFIGKVIAVYYKLDGTSERADVELCYPEWWKGTKIS